MAVADLSPAAPDYERFVTEHAAVLRRCVARQLRDAPNDVDDALQEGLLRVWRQFPSWGAADAQQRLAFAQRLLKQAAYDVLRKRWGHDLQRRGKEIAVDFYAVDSPPAGDDAGPRDQVLTELTRLIAAMHEQDADADPDGELDRRSSALFTSMAALTPLEQQVFYAHHPQGARRKSTEVARLLGISHAKAREVYMEACAILRPLMAHALAPELPVGERERVLAYTSGEMRNWRERSRMKRHLAHCADCRALADAERVVVGAGARLLLPLPALLGAVKASAASAAVAGGAAATTGGSGPLGGLLAGGAAKGAALVMTSAVVLAGGYAALKPQQLAASPAAPVPVAAPAEPAVAVTEPAAPARPSRPTRKRRSDSPALRTRPVPRARRRPSGARTDAATTPSAPVRASSPHAVDPPTAAGASSDSFQDEFTP